MKKSCTLHEVILQISPDLLKEKREHTCAFLEPNIKRSRDILNDIPNLQHQHLLKTTYCKLPADNNQGRIGSYNNFLPCTSPACPHEPVLPLACNRQRGGASLSLARARAASILSIKEWIHRHPSSDLACKDWSDWTVWSSPPSSANRLLISSRAVGFVRTSAGLAFVCTFFQSSCPFASAPCSHKNFTSM